MAKLRYKDEYGIWHEIAGGGGGGRDITVDEEVSENSGNPVASSGIYRFVENIKNDMLDTAIKGGTYWSFGNSMCQNQGTTANPKYNNPTGIEGKGDLWRGYVEEIEKRFGVTCQNKAVGGQPIAPNGFITASALNFSGVDLVTTQWIGSDYDTQSPIGEIGDNDFTTFIGAYSEFYRKVYTDNPFCICIMVGRGKKNGTTETPKKHVVIRNQVLTANGVTYRLGSRGCTSGSQLLSMTRYAKETTTNVYDIVPEAAKKADNIAIAFSARPTSLSGQVLTFGAGTLTVDGAEYALASTSVTLGDSPVSVSETIDGVGTFAYTVEIQELTIEDYINAQKKVAEKYGVPYADLFHQSQRNIYNNEWLTIGDEFHPNTLGYLREAGFVVAKVEEAVRCLPKMIPVERIEISGPTTVRMGENIQLVPTVYPENATTKVVRFETDDITVAHFNTGQNAYKGKLYAQNKTGTVTVTARARDGSGVLGTCTVTVVTQEADNA